MGQHPSKTTQHITAHYTSSQRSELLEDPLQNGTCNLLQSSPGVSEEHVPSNHKALQEATPFPPTCHLEKSMPGSGQGLWGKVLAYPLPLKLLQALRPSLSAPLSHKVYLLMPGG